MREAHSDPELDVRVLDRAAHTHDHNDLLSGWTSAPRRQVLADHHVLRHRLDHTGPVRPTRRSRARG